MAQQAPTQLWTRLLGPSQPAVKVTKQVLSAACFLLRHVRVPIRCASCSWVFADVELCPRATHAGWDILPSIPRQSGHAASLDM